MRLASSVQRTRRFIQQQYPRLPDECTGDTQALSLPPAELSTFEAEVCIETVREGLDEIEYTTISARPRGKAEGRLTMLVDMPIRAEIE